MENLRKLLKKMKETFDLQDVAFIVFYLLILVLAVSSKPFEIPNYEETTSLLKIIYNDFSNLASIIPFLISVLLLFYNNKVKNTYDKNGIIVISLVSCCLNRYAYIAQLDAVYFVIFNILFIILYYIFCIRFVANSHDKICNSINGDKGYIKDAIKNISNKNLLAFQLFHCTILNNDRNYLFKLNYVDQLCRLDVDINCISSCSLVLPNKYYKAFFNAKDLYSKLSAK